MAERVRYGRTCCSSERKGLGEPGMPVSFSPSSLAASRGELAELRPHSHVGRRLTRLSSLYSIRSRGTGRASGWLCSVSTESLSPLSGPAPLGTHSVGVSSHAHEHASLPSTQVHRAQDDADARHEGERVLRERARGPGRQGRFRGPPGDVRAHWLRPEGVHGREGPQAGPPGAGRACPGVRRDSLRAL